MIIGQRIKEMRTERNVSQKKLADAVGVDKRAIIFWEQEVNEPKATYIRNLAVFFGCSADYLLGLTDE
ncbi:MAG: helix-turn-helix domain-containing protein [Clostridiales bacterium]|nr:helix-turn-helix domain-containing protein [Clostridiales bacterium]